MGFADYARLVLDDKLWAVCIKNTWKVLIRISTKTFRCYTNSFSLRD